MIYVSVRVQCLELVYDEEEIPRRIPRRIH